MNTKYLIYSLLLGLSGMTLISGCKKFLDEKTIKSYTIPSKLSDLQALLDNESIMMQSDVSAGEVCSGDYYLTDAVWTALSAENYRRMYSWEKNDVFAIANNEWNSAYRTVNVTNEVLTNLKKMEITGQHDAWANIAGQAYFHRGRMFFAVASVWANTYDTQSSSLDLGIPLRLNVNFNEQSTRASVAETYAQIIGDLKNAIHYLPSNTTTNFRPSKASAYGMLARIYLSMRNYQEAGFYADSCLQLKRTLLDYNTLNSNVAYPFSKLNVEVISESYASVPTPVSPSRARIMENLYDMYEPNDLRKILFFKTNADKSYAFKGGYEGLSALFTGIAVDEMYLVRAESYARSGKIQECLNDLNTLLIKRFKKGTFSPLTANSADDAIELVLVERRKELLMRCLRWTDLKRLNKEGKEIMLRRTLKGITYTLLPNDLRYALAIPEDVIRLSGMAQNP